jgi:hypothetical protein
MQIRFTIEQRHLTDAQGHPMSPSSPGVAFHSREAGDADQAVRLIASELRGEVIGEVLRFPGFRAIATVRNDTGVFTIEVSPSSQQSLPVME